MFNTALYTSKFEELSAAGDRAALEAFLKKQLEIIDVPFAPSGGCPCGKSQEALDTECLDWINDRASAQVLIRSDLADLYFRAKEWDACFAVFNELYGNLREADLLNTVLHGRILLNESCVRMEHGEMDAAKQQALKASALFEVSPDRVDKNTLVANYNLLSAIHQRQGDMDQAKAFYSKAVLAAQRDA